MTEYDFLTRNALRVFIDRALKEDLHELHSGDPSSLGAISQSKHAVAELRIKDDGIIAGLEMAKMIFHRVDNDITFTPFFQDGDPVTNDLIAFRVEGNARSILASERLVLNCMQRMSGIATKTRLMVNLIRGTGARLLDTRKTTPNFRLAEKWAVQIGGGFNHRFGLFDMVMLKDNHIDFAGGIEPAIKATREYLKANGLDLKVEVETRSLQEVQEVIRVGGVDVVMLDNMMPSQMKAAVELINGRFSTEASGGITEQTVKEVADCGVDYISVGALTHSYKSLDLSLKALPS